MDTTTCDYYSDELIQVIGETILGKVTMMNYEKMEENCDSENLEMVTHANLSKVEVGISGEPVDPDGENERLSPNLCGSEIAPHLQPPSEAAQVKHNLSHLPYQPWCEACVRARAVSQGYRQVESHSYPLVEMNYSFVESGDVDYVRIPILVATVKPSGYMLAVAVKQKGPKDKYVLQTIMNWLAEAGLHGPIRLRTNSEPSIRAVAAKLVARRCATTLLETTPIGSKSDVVERACAKIGSMSRTLSCSRSIVALQC
jgi:hypothetical protein